MTPKNNVLSKKQIPNASSTFRTQIPFDDSRFLGVEQEGMLENLQPEEFGLKRDFS